MTLFAANAEVLVTATWSTYFRRRGHVVRVDSSGPWVLLDGDDEPIAARWDELCVFEPPKSIGGAE